MPRPTKCRLIKSKPSVVLFKPAGISARVLDHVNLTYEELEAVRLKDLEGLDQTNAASQMDVSRPTYQRILNSARHKISDGLVNGKAIRIEGGNYAVSDVDIPDMGCGHGWSDRMDGMCPRRAANSGDAAGVNEGLKANEGDLE